MSVYEDAIAIIRQDLDIIFKEQQEFTPISEVKQIELLLDAMELKLAYFYQLLPRLDVRRGIMNFGGTVLKSLFGVAVTADVNQLHSALDRIKMREDDISHSLSLIIYYTFETWNLWYK
jgi:hypothetical protein